MARTWLAVLAVVSLVGPALAGCTQMPVEDGDDLPNGTDGNRSGNGTPVTVAVAIEDAPDLVETGETINVTWRVDTSTGDEIEIPHTAVHWANASVADPQSPADYGNTSGAKEPATVPATFSTSFTVDDEQTIHLRAHARHDGADVWSDEVRIQVQQAWDPTVHTVEIGTNTTGPLANYEPADLTIQVGDGIKWVNRDPTVQHTATSDDGAPESFTTGQLAEGDESDVVYFNTTGTYGYHCSNHPDTMSAQFEVVEG